MDERRLRRARAAASVMWGAVWAFAAAIPCRVSAEAPSGSVYITTLPSGAEVFVDGTYVGHSPALVGGLVRGRHAITLTKAGWVVQEVDVSIATGTIAMSSTRLIPGPRAYSPNATGTVVFRGAPTDASFMLDGTVFAPSPQPYALTAGSHDVAMKTSTGRITRMIDVLPNTTTQVVLRVPKADQPRTSIVAPAEDYLPTDAFSLDGTKFVVHYGGHVVVGHLDDASIRVDGTSATFDAAPEKIAGRLYLPLLLLEKLAGDTSK